jgi:nucleotide-binding universal stress UspA family protein
MSYKTILVHCDTSKSVSHRLAVAADLARRFGARLVGLYVRKPFEAPAFLDGGFAMGDYFNRYDEDVKADETEASAAFAKTTKGKGLATEWQVANGYVDRELSVQARYADLVVVGQAGPEPTATPSDLPETVALSTGRPVLVVPFIGAKAPGKIVLLCWNGSREAARAAADALPFLKAAQQVIVLVVSPTAAAEGHGADPGADPGADAAVWLARHGVKVTVQRDVAPDADVGGVILSRAADHDAGLIVMGVYGHSRMREMVLGGVSRTLLASMTVPIFMCH